MNKQYTAAIDLGSSKIRMALANKNSNHKNKIIAISESTHKGISRGLVLNIDETVKAIKACVNDIFKQTNILIKTVNVNYNGQHLELIKKRLSFDLEPKEFESDDFDYISLIKRTYPNLFKKNVEILQVTPISTPLTAEKQTIIDLNIITGYRTAIQNLKTTIKRAGLELNQLLPDPLSASYSVLTSKEKEEGVVLVDIGRDTTNLAFFHQNRLQKYLAFPAGGSHINRVLISVFKITKKQAQAYKLKHGIILKEHFSEQYEIFIDETNINKQKRISVNDLQFVIRDVTKDLVDVILPSFKDANNINSIKHGIVITGGAANLKNLDLLINKLTGCKVRLGLPKCNDNTKSFVEINKPNYATLIGLVNYQ